MGFLHIDFDLVTLLLHSQELVTGGLAPSRCLLGGKYLPSASSGEPGQVYVLLYLEPHSGVSIESQVVQCGSSHNLGFFYEVSPVEVEQLGTLFTD